MPENIWIIVAIIGGLVFTMVRIILLIIKEEKLGKTPKQIEDIIRRSNEKEI